MENSIDMNRFVAAEKELEDTNGEDGSGDPAYSLQHV
jgi:hypothetical protein